MMVFSTWELLDLAGSPRNPRGELRLVLRLLAQDRLVLVPVALPVRRPALARAA